MENGTADILKYLADVEKRLKKLYGDTYSSVLRIAEVRKAIAEGRGDFTWKGSEPLTKKQLDSYINTLTDKAGVLIANGIEDGYKKGTDKAREDFLGKLGTDEKRRAEANSVFEQAVNERRKEGMTAHVYATAKRGGLNLSERVWNINANTKQELEALIQNGILEGNGAAEIANGIKGYLNSPNALFRRVRNKKTGNLELSEAAKRYRPGQGVYRSAFKNAMRLARTEMTAAYRRAEWESYQNNPLILSYEIRLSNNHTTAVKGKVVRLTDICDRLAGIYPKTFLWEGWHPQCRCVMIPITISVKDFGSYLKAKREQKLKDWKPTDKGTPKVTEMPKNFTDWIAENKRRLQEAKELPYWITENGALLDAPQYGTVTGIKLGKGATKEAYKDYKDTPAPNLSQEAKDNAHEVAREFGITAPIKPMTFLEANEGKGNIDYGKGDMFRYNCQACIAVHEARLRGLPITALGYDAAKGSVSRKLGDRFQDAFLNPKTGKSPEVTMVKGSTFNELLKGVNDRTRGVGRYAIGINMMENGQESGHVITAERLLNNKLLLYDAQNGQFVNLKEYELMGVSSFEVLRVDRLLLRKDYLKAIARVL